MKIERLELQAEELVQTYLSPEDAKEAIECFRQRAGLRKHYLHLLTSKNLKEISERDQKLIEDIAHYCCGF